MNSTSSRSVLIVAAHPDDEVLGAGGTVGLHCDRGDRVTSVVVAAGSLIHERDRDEGVWAQARAAARVLGVRDLRLMEFPDQGLDRHSLVEIVSPLETVIEEVQPEIVYLQFGYDINRDHQLLFQAGLVATRPVNHFIRAVYAFETASSTEWAYPRSFVGDTWVDISTTLERKLDAMACYATELRDWPHPRSLRALRAAAESAGSEVCAEAAERFMTVRRVVRDGETPV